VFGRGVRPRVDNSDHRGQRVYEGSALAVLYFFYHKMLTTQCTSTRSYWLPEYRKVELCLKHQHNNTALADTVIHVEAYENICSTKGFCNSIYNKKIIVFVVKKCFRY